jgi:TATA-box binding protein (TBP) (component of TFIID and TFIIIB)
MESLICEYCSKVTFLCECEKTWKTFDCILKKDCQGQTNEMITYTSLNVSTMTVCFTFNQYINLQLLKDTLCERLPVSYKPGSRKSKEKKKKGTDSFYNSFDIKLTFVDRTVEPMVFSNVSIFIFPNGKVKAAGIRTINTIHVMIEELIETIGMVQNVDTLVAENIKIQMICSDFKIKPIKEDSDGWCLKQELLKNILVEENYSATFSALSRYPGINLKYPSTMEKGKQISLLIFRSGSIIITGAKYIQDIAESYKFIISIISKHNKQLFYYDINEEIKQKKKNGNKNVRNK